MRATDADRQLLDFQSSADGVNLCPTYEQPGFLLRSTACLSAPFSGNRLSDRRTQQR